MDSIAMEADTDTTSAMDIDNTLLTSTKKPNQSTSALNNVPKTLKDLLLRVHENIINDNVLNALIYTLKKYKFSPALQVKHFHSNPRLILLHNTYKRIDIDHFKELYNECRSVILDLNLPMDQQILVKFSGNIPDHISDKQYETIKKSSDVCDESYDGTIISVYNYDDKWYMGTSTSPTIDSSRYFHPTKTHGNMVDEAIAKIYNMTLPTDDESSYTLRKVFTDSLDPSKTYVFILIHYQNFHTINYTPLYGNEYAKLVHVSTKNKGSDVNDDISSMPFSSLGILYPRRFNSPDEGLEYIRSTPVTYGLIITDETNNRWKVSDEKIIKYEECNCGHHNVWYNMITVYLKNKANYKIVNYQNDYCPNLEFPKNSYGQELAPTYIIHTVITTMRDILLNYYSQTTTYNKHTKRYWVNRELDNDLAPIIRFHLKQLRNIQITSYRDASINLRTVLDYLRYHQTLQNIRLLIKYFATEWFSKYKERKNIPSRTEDCFVILNNLLNE